MFLINSPETGSKGSKDKQNVVIVSADTHHRMAIKNKETESGHTVIACTGDYKAAKEIFGLIAKGSLKPDRLLVDPTMVNAFKNPKHIIKFFNQMAPVKETGCRIEDITPEESSVLLHPALCGVFERLCSIEEPPAD